MVWETEEFSLETGAAVVLNAFSIAMRSDNNISCVQTVQQFTFDWPHSWQTWRHTEPCSTPRHLPLLSQSLALGPSGSVETVTENKIHQMKKWDRVSKSDYVTFGPSGWLKFLMHRGITPSDNGKLRLNTM